MPRQKKFNKSDVVQDAMLLFWKKGFHQTSVKDLVQEIGINRASLYDTYQDKEGLFKESFTFYRELLKSNIEAIFDKHPSVKSGFNDFINYIIIDILGSKNGCLVSNSYSELLPSKNQDFEIELDETRKMWRKLIISIIKKAKKQKELIDPNINLEFTADLIYINLAGVAILSKTKIDSKKLQYSLEEIRDKILFK